MATTAHPTGLAVPSADRPTRLLTLGKRVIDAIVASRVEAAKAELRPHDLLVRETALTHGPYPTISLDKADLLPFNA